MRRGLGLLFTGVGALAALALTACAAPAAGTSGNPQDPGGTLPMSNAASRNLAEVAATTGAALGGQQSGIWVTGQGRVSVMPDLAVLNVGVEARAPTVQEARAQAAEAMQRVIAALKAQGVADRDIQTSYFSIQPQYDYNRTSTPTLIGYIVSNQVTAKVRDLEKVGEVIDAAAEAGGDLTRIHGVGFTVEDNTDALRQARERAVADARAKAQQLAQLGGVQLGSLVYISEGSGAMPPPVPYARMDLAAESGALKTPIQVGELDVVVTVQAGFAIQ